MYLCFPGADTEGQDVSGPSWGWRRASSLGWPGGWEGGSEGRPLPAFGPERPSGGETTTATAHELKEWFCLGRCWVRLKTKPLTLHPVLEAMEKKNPFFHSLFKELPICSKEKRAVRSFRVIAVTPLDSSLHEEREGQR